MSAATAQKPVSTQSGWHPEDIKCALRKRGLSLADVSRAIGLRGDSARVALRQPWPRVERAIADALGVTPEELWPGRYDTAGRPKRHAY